MLDIKFIGENPDAVKRACELKGFTDYTDQILELDARVRELKTVTQSKTAEKNKITREIPTATDKAPLIAASKAIANEIANDMAELDEKEKQLCARRAFNAAGRNILGLFRNLWAVFNAKLQNGHQFSGVRSPFGCRNHIGGVRLYSRCARYARCMENT